MLNPPPPPDPFLIGTHGFAPEFDPVNHVCHFVRGVIPIPADLDERQRFLSDTHFELARALGLNLISTVLDPRDVVTSPENNVVHQIVDAGTPATGDTLRVAVQDFGVAAFLAGERIMLHPESNLDFTELGDYERFPVDLFNNLPVDSAKLSSPLLLANPTDNLIRMEIGKGIVTGVDSLRKEDLSLFREWWDDATQAENAASGLYIVSVTAQLESPLTDPTSDTPLMYLDIHTVLSTDRLAERTIRLPLRERHFFDSAGTRINGPVEIVLGMIEIRQAVNAPNALGVTYVDLRRNGNPAWNDTTLTAYAKILDANDRDFSDSITAKYDGLDISLQYSDEGSATFLLDAVCLSSPRTFAIFYPDHRIFYPSSGMNPPPEWEPRLIAWQRTRQSFDARLNAILTDGGKVAEPFPSLRYIYGPEQGLHSAQWPLSSVANLLLREQHGQRYNIFCAAGYSEEPTVSGAFSRRFASGYYGYPIRAEYPRPVYDDVVPGLYHQALNRDNFRGFVEVSRRYRNHAETRIQIGRVHPWLPFIQNHSLLYTTSIPRWHDGDSLREPTAAELRTQCNIALAHGADGLVFYNFTSAPWITTNAFWPPDSATWANDRIAGHPFFDVNAGTLGFVDPDDITGRPVPRRLDWNGENKWDSTTAFIHDFLAPVGNMINSSLSWQRAKLWSIRNHPDAGDNELVNEVLSMRQDAVDPIDAKDSTFVIVSEFVHRTTGDNYLFVLNGRTHPTEGHRHITVKLKPDADPSRQWTVENITSGDMWIVKPRNSPDSLTTANGFTDYFPPGSAALYRLVPYQRGSLPFGETCFEHTLTVTKGASVLLTGSKINLAPQGCIVTEDSLSLSGCEVRCCDLEAIANVYVRNGGRLRLGNDGSRPTTVTRVPISVGSGSSINANLAVFSGIWYGTGAINLYDGYARTNHNSVDVRGGGHFIDMYGGELYATGDSVQGNNCCWTVGVQTTGGQVYVEDERFLDLTCGIWAMGGAYVQGCDSAAPRIGRNKIRSYMMGMYCSNSELQFGELPWGQINNWYASQNSIGVTDTASTWHISASSGTVYAHANFWCQGTTPPLQQCAPHNYGNVEAMGALTIDPVPFIGDPKTVSSTMQKDLSSSSQSPPGGVRQTVLQHISAGLHANARAAIESFLLSGGGLSASVEDLAFLYRNIRRIDAPALVANLLAVCINRQDLRSKLLAADILKSEGDPASALSILNAYSFVGSSELMRDAFVRKAILYPLSQPGGYGSGMAVLDTLRSLVSIDSTLAWFIEVYPKLFSGLDHAAQSPFPKSRAGDFTGAIQAEGVDVWPNYPNPFSDVTSFTFKIGEDKHVRLAIYDAMGREVTVITDADYQRGVHSTVLRSGDLPSGLYFYRLTTDEGVIQRKMLLMR